MQAHVFFPGPHVTHDGARICEGCGDVERAKVHRLPHGQRRGARGRRAQVGGARLVAYKKVTIPQDVRRTVALRYGCQPGEAIVVPCHYCRRPGRITWFRLYGGRPSAWVHFEHQMDHVIPEYHGGPTTASNIVLACKRCNCSKGARI